ncbi:MAG TPA: hypothetical protein VFA28_03810 [Bryobacteraceae bacterium]|jgi:hypothetical protein|nr:hypothetical protein [Bryobacteraceae bacterium]
MTRLNQHREMATLLSTPILLGLYALGFWCLAAQIGWASEFIVQQGPFANWMIWMGLAGGAQLALKRLSSLRMGRVVKAVSRAKIIEPLPDGVLSSVRVKV